MSVVQAVNSYLPIALMRKYIQHGYDEARREFDIQLENAPKTRRRSPKRKAQ